MEHIKSVLPTEGGGYAMTRILQTKGQSTKDKGFIVHKKYLKRKPVWGFL
jgi:hypothetical protein